MLTNLSLENFKSWKRIENMRLAPITGLFGANSSGKTSILQFLLMLKQTVESTDRQKVLEFGNYGGGYVNLGSFRDVIYGHVETGCLRWSLAFTLPEPLVVQGPDSESSSAFGDDKLEFDASVRETTDGQLVVHEMKYRFSGRDFGLEESGKGKKPIPRGVSSANGQYRLVQRGPAPAKLRLVPGRSAHLPHPVKSFGFPNEVFSFFQNAGFLADLQLAFERQVGLFRYLGPVRLDPERIYYAGPGHSTGDVGTRGESVIEAIRSSRQRGEKISRGRGQPKLTLEECVADWLRRLGLIDSFKLETVPWGDAVQVLVRKSSESTFVKITDVGFGISQILPVIVLCYYAPEGSTIILEQPEVHLHPSVQAGLADVLIDAIRVRKIQIIVESHSEHLLRRLQRRIAEGKTLKNDDVALYFCRFDGKESQLDPLDVDPYGNIRNWPEGFFGNEFEEMAETTLAAMKRKSKAPEKS
jgi:predicted ATPase